MVGAGTILGDGIALGLGTDLGASIVGVGVGIIGAGIILMLGIMDGVGMQDLALAGTHGAHLIMAMHTMDFTTITITEEELLTTLVDEEH